MFRRMAEAVTTPLGIGQTALQGLLAGDANNGSDTEEGNAFQALMDRPLTLRPVRRLEVLTWDGRPVRQSEAFDALVRAGFTADGPRLSWDGYPGPRAAR